jgi:hypothetical protein
LYVFCFSIISIIFITNFLLFFSIVADLPHAPPSMNNPRRFIRSSLVLPRTPPVRPRHALDAVSLSSATSKASSARPQMPIVSSSKAI